MYGIFLMHYNFLVEIFVCKKVAFVSLTVKRIRTSGSSHFFFFFFYINSD